MAKITVWSKQHENVWKVLQETGRYTVKREYIIKDLKEHSELVLDTYEWLVKNGPDYGDKADEKRHKELLEAYGVSDTQAYMSQFYPEIKREIRESWKRLFDDDIQIGSDGCYGNIWEVRREWVKNVIQ